jgi:hypothetical protein
MAPGGAARPATGLLQQGPCNRAQWPQAASVVTFPMGKSGILRTRGYLLNQLPKQWKIPQGRSKVAHIINRWWILVESTSRSIQSRIGTIQDPGSFNRNHKGFAWQLTRSELLVRKERHFLPLMRTDCPCCRSFDRGC